jgi:hypothetical protein
MENKEVLEELRKLIKLELKDCDGERWPHVCKMQSNEKGYQRIEEMIIRHVAKERMPIGSAIAHIEQELAHSESESESESEPESEPDGQ